jgi:hypothetical protein
MTKEEKKHSLVSLFVGLLPLSCIPIWIRIIIRSEQIIVPILFLCCFAVILTLGAIVPSIISLSRKKLSGFMVQTVFLLLAVPFGTAVGIWNLMFHAKSKDKEPPTSGSTLRATSGATVNFSVR